MVLMIILPQILPKRETPPDWTTWPQTIESLQPGNEAFKRKLIDRGEIPSGERKAHLISDMKVSSEIPITTEATPPRAMSIICLNCRGLGDPEAVSKLRTFLQKHSPSLVSLSKIKHSSLEIEMIKKKFRNFDGVAADARSHSGGVALLWKKGLDVSLISISLNHVDVTAKNIGSPSEWHFTGIYEYPETHNKNKTCDLLKDLSEHSHLPRLIGGDINEIFFNFEKTGGEQTTSNS
ncbi:hypothetical protein Cgig2_013386 [Carnegiea gigantea]|uniref:Endonuclease/exonuclease/phosphatase domain-containing protein n=1 Tax=Carnegiea gigantea TaxID=171969 RepID=A0A9Q1K7P8_9CARY|nr:hypothetical protein Cgig2_013386 [Carnegiea gigantea]